MPSLKLGVGVREDVITLWEELDEARNTLAEIQALLCEIKDPKETPGTYINAQFFCNVWRSLFVWSTHTIGHVVRIWNTGNSCTHRRESFPFNRTFFSKTGQLLKENCCFNVSLLDVCTIHVCPTLDFQHFYRGRECTCLFHFSSLSFLLVWGRRTHITLF